MTVQEILFLVGVTALICGGCCIAYVKTLVAKLYDDFDVDYYPLIQDLKTKKEELDSCFKRCLDAEEKTTDCLNRIESIETRISQNELKLKDLKAILIEEQSQKLESLKLVFQDENND